MDVYRPAGNRGAVLRNNRLYMHRWHVTVCCHSYNERKRGPFWRVPLCKPPAHCLAMAAQNATTPNVLGGRFCWVHREFHDDWMQRGSGFLLLQPSVCDDFIQRFSLFLTKNPVFRQLLLMVLQVSACTAARAFDFYEKSKEKTVKYSEIFKKTRAKLRKKWYNK